VSGDRELAPLERTLESLLFLSADPVTLDELIAATQEHGDDVARALANLREYLEFEGRGIVLRELAGGFALHAAPDTEPAARRLLSKPRTPPLTPAQAETLSVVAYLQPVSRPEVARIRGVNSESPTATLVERGLIEEAGRSPFGAILYRTTPLFLRLFGLQSPKDLPDVAQWDPAPEEQAELRDRLLKAGDARAGVAPQPT
jgi:segregation and condensation protein B